MNFQSILCSRQTEFICAYEAKTWAVVGVLKNLTNFDNKIKVFCAEIFCIVLLFQAMEGEIYMWKAGCKIEAIFTETLVPDGK